MGNLKVKVELLANIERGPNLLVSLIGPLDGGSESLAPPQVWQHYIYCMVTYHKKNVLSSRLTGSTGCFHPFAHARSESLQLHCLIVFGVAESPIDHWKYSTRHSTSELT
jgi:hypothetical protein